MPYWLYEAHDKNIPCTVAPSSYAPDQKNSNLPHVSKQAELAKALSPSSIACASLVLGFIASSHLILTHPLTVASDCLILTSRKITKMYKITSIYREV